MKLNYCDMLLEACEMDRLTEQKKEKIRRQHLWERLTSPSVPMLLHCQPNPWENLESLMFRAAKINALDSISGLQRALRLPEGKPISKTRHQQLSDCMGSEYALMASMLPILVDKNTINFGCHCLPNKHLALTTSRIGPSCVAERGYGMQYWNLAPFAVCEEHGTYLIDHCSCTPPTRLNSARPGYAICRCGRDLTQAEVTLGTPSAQILSRQIVRMFKGESLMTYDKEDKSTLKMPDEIDLSGLLDMIVFLGALQSDAKIMGLHLKNARVSMNVVIDQFEKAALALTNWPHGLFAVLRTVRRPGNEQISQRMVAAGLNHVLNAAIKHLRPNILKWFLDGCGEYLNSPNAWKSSDSQLR